MDASEPTSGVGRRITRGLARYYLDLGFYSNAIEFGPTLMTRRAAWSAASYALLVLGLLCQQAIDLSRSPLVISTISDWRTFVATAIVGAALFAPFTHWVTKRRPKPSWEHVLWAFSFGFFVNLSTSWIWKHLL